MYQSVSERSTLCICLSVSQLSTGEARWDTEDQ